MRRWASQNPIGANFQALNVKVKERSELAPAYASQLSCQLGEHGHEDLSCEGESFKPLAAQSGASSYSLIFAVPLGVLAFSPAIAILT